MKFLKMNQDLTFEIIDADPTDKLKTLQSAVDGVICSVRGYFDLPENTWAWANDEGLYRDDFEPVLYYKHDQGDGVLKGPIVFTGMSDVGQTLGLSDELIEEIKISVEGMPCCRVSGDGTKWKIVLHVDLNSDVQD